MSLDEVVDRLLLQPPLSLSRPPFPQLNTFDRSPLLLLSWLILFLLFFSLSLLLLLMLLLFLGFVFLVGGVVVVVVVVVIVALAVLFWPATSASYSLSSSLFLGSGPKGTMTYGTTTY